MKPALLGLVVLGTTVAIYRARRMGHRMREHCEQMAAQCKQVAE